MKRTLLFTSMLSLPFLFSCGVFQSDDSTFQPGEKGYTYSGFDETDDTVIRGSLRLQFSETGDEQTPLNVAGTWNLMKVKDAEKLGPQIGTGDLEGSVSAVGEIWLNLNPGWADNNVFLAGHFSSHSLDEFEGTWTYSTFVGPTNSGSFEAKR